MLSKEIHLAKREWEAARNYFDLVSDPELVDYAVFALETAKNAGFATVGVYDSHQTAKVRVSAASDIYLGEGKTLIDALEHVEIE